MPTITLEQALFVRPDRHPPSARARSSGFHDAWLIDSHSLIEGFGERPNDAFHCPPQTVFAHRLNDKHVAVVRVQDDPGPTAGMRFHFLIVDKTTYETWIRDPFHLAAKVEPAWDATELPTISLPTDSFVPRKVTEIQAVLKRVKRSALHAGVDPQSPEFERTIENSESPVLLGGAQILVDGGRLVFERPDGDLAFVSGLWLLLPESTRARLWPTSFAFSRKLEFDVLVLPHVDDAGLEGYTTEQQAGDYPQGAYEFALQKAAEAGDQKELDAVVTRRDGWQTIKLGLVLLVLLSFVVFASRWLGSSDSLPERTQKIMTAVGMVGVGDPLTAYTMRLHGHQLWKAED